MSLEPSNPFASRSTLPYELPPFAQITDEHYLPAFYAGMEEHLAEINAIIDSSEDATFANTIVAMERSGRLLQRVAVVFYNKSSSDTNEKIQAIEEEIAPKMAAHQDAIRLNPALFARVKGLFDAKDELALSAEDDWLLTRYYRDFVYAGAHLDEAQREELKGFNQEISKLSTQFSKLLLADTNDLAVVVDSAEELDGLSDAEIAACASAANDRGLDGKYLVAAVNFSGNPLLASLKNRDLREKLMKNSLIKGGRGNENDTRKFIVEMANLRAKRAQLFGVKTHADYIIGEQTAGTVENVHAMMRKIAPPAVRNARSEAADMQAAVKASGETFELKSWDWDFYADIVRKEKFSVDTTALRPYFELERVLIDGVFFAANKLFGLTFTERADLVGYHPEVRVWEVHNEDGSALGLYLGDFFTRDSKRGGAWMNSLVLQNDLFEQLPVVVNNLNAPKPPAGEPALLTFDMTTTLFHEFGHALHGLLSAVRYPRVSGTAVQRDFVEFPSQVNEMWILWPEVVENYARHYQTGEALPKEIIENIKNAAVFNEGYATTSYLAAAILDLAWHSLTPDQKISVDDVEAFEARAIAEYGLEFEPVPVRYRSTYFSHIWGGGYSAGYYGYIWSEVLDAETVEWFKDNGGLTRANGDHFRAELLSRGGSIDSMQMFRNFRGRDATIEPLLARRGLL
jgi:peptidyl-dipeptidase Dcp